MIISERLGIHDPVSAFDRIMGEIGIERYLKLEA